MDVISDSGNIGSIDGSDKRTIVCIASSIVVPTGINLHGKVPSSNLHSRYI